MPYINISNCPITGKSRRVDIIKTNEICGVEMFKAIILICRVDYISDENEVIRTQGINSYEIELKADNTTQVKPINPLTGQLLPGTTEEDLWGEYDYILYLFDNLIIGPTLLKQIIVSMKDSEEGGWRFNR